jgi:hypothetical protein
MSNSNPVATDVPFKVWGHRSDHYNISNKLTSPLNIKWVYIPKSMLEGKIPKY